MSKRAIIFGIAATIALAMWAKRPSHKINTSDNSSRPAPTKSMGAKVSAAPLMKVEENKLSAPQASVMEDVLPNLSNSPAVDEAAIREQKEIEALETLTGLVASFAKNHFLDAKSMAAQLKKLNLDPVIADWSNEDAGKMEIVRTNDTLPGTRYFHAQFFENDDGTPSLQHVSFEFRPSRDAMDIAIKTAENMYGNILSHRIQNDQDYVLWATNDGHIVYVQKMGLKDLKDNPFNAYTSNDVGTVKIAMEIDIHDAQHNHEL